MKTLIIISTINSICIMYLIVKPLFSRIEIKIDRTFWEKKPYGFTITKWDYPVGVVPNSGKGIFNFNWRFKPKDDIKRPPAPCFIEEQHCL